MPRHKQAYTGERQKMGAPVCTALLNRTLLVGQQGSKPCPSHSNPAGQGTPPAFAPSTPPSPSH